MNYNKWILQWDGRHNLFAVIVIQTGAIERDRFILRQASCVQSGDHPVTSLGESIKIVIPNNSAPPMKSSARPTFFHIPAFSFLNNGTFDCLVKRCHEDPFRMFLNFDQKQDFFLLLF
jgi:hypothetical protein